MSDVLELGFVPVTQAALALKVSREKLIRRVQNGLVEGRMIAGHWYVAKTEIQAAATRNTPTERSA